MEELYYPCSGSTGTVFVFVYAKIQFSHNEAYILKERPIFSKWLHKFLTENQYSHS